MKRRELLVGAGRLHERRIQVNGRIGWDDLTTLDHNPDHKPDVVHDLDCYPYPFEDDAFDEVHAYEVLEHCGSQGDWRAFFAQFAEIWRILKPGGFLAATCPSWRSMWAWGDPSHRRVLNAGSLVFLDQQEYRTQVDGIGPNGEPTKQTSMSDFRHWYAADFVPAEAPGQPGRAFVSDDGEHFVFVLQAIKPSRLARWRQKS